MNSGRRWLTLPGRRRFECFLRGSGPELLVVHPGGPGFTGEYLSGLLALARPGLRVLLLHPRGVGRSWAPSRPSAYTLAAHVRDLEAIRTALRVDRMHLLGYSAGGFVALEYALKHPQRLRSLLLCGTAGSAEEIREANRIMLRAASPVQRRRLRSLTLLGAFGTPEYESLVEQIGRPFQTRFLPADSPPLGRLSPNVYRAMMTRTGDEFVVDGTLARWDARSGYRRLRTPTLVLVGRFDFFLGAARRAAAAIPGAELIVLARSSHMGPLEEPVAFRSAVDRFLRRVKPARPGSSRPADPARIAPSRRVGRTRPVRSVRGAR